MAALDGIFELSSILKTEDLEKGDLNRKKIATQQAINQQENRVSSMRWDCSVWQLNTFMFLFYVLAHP